MNAPEPPPEREREAQPQEPERLPTVFEDLLATHETPGRPVFATGLRRSRAGRRAANRATEQRSLFGEILDWMFAPLLLLWPLSIAVTFLVARSLADAPFDRSLHDRAIVLAQQVRSAPTTSADRREALERAARELFDLEAEGQYFYQVVDEGGVLLAGHRDFPRPRLFDFPDASRVKLRNVTIRGNELRAAYTYVTMQQGEGAETQALVQVAETLEQRGILANEIIKGVILPQFLILPVALGLVWFGLSRGLAPLKSLQARIRARRPDDLSPVDPHGAPEEIVPLVAAFNDLLARQSQTLQTQRRFIADAAHQMKTPLAGLRSQAELAMRESDPDQLRRSLQQLIRSAERSAHLVSQLLALARMENLGASTPLESLGLHPLVRTAAADWTAFAMRRRIDFGVENDDRPAPIAGHPLLLRELINNLIDNALRYTPVGGVVTVRTRSTPDRVLLEVEDNGPGIPLSERALVFERFYRIADAPGEGSGLGLPIVSEIAEHHHATVRIDDGLPWPAGRGSGHGTRVTVVFPKQQDL
ncbi:sensor histidine kinase N-terminal domain-containing protein [Burkholderiaceae bacterium FT117]|uniref:sensor histidine kinase n=1 Tax=Zeimonas sediminis TaxID=2944268 RepID=UPI002342EA4A|nr:sensor histidine kinase [Zeimonas sediminis]MCM5570278.1 sensor histidine kinase N-terminal domain-containing protein [Zeimonas sediminis]